MNQEEENRFRRNYVSNMYPGPSWQEKVANMPTDRVTAIYLRFIRDSQKPKPTSPEKLEEEIEKEEPEDNPDQGKLFE